MNQDAHAGNLGRFVGHRYGLFIHYGLYSQLGRGEWAMNRERISPGQLRGMASGFRPERFDAGAICDLALRAGMRYVCFTTMHHEGFRLYRSTLSDFTSDRVCGRDLTAELVAAARARGLGVSLYHSLNNWFDAPDSVAALEDPAAHRVFIASTHARVLELVRNYDLDVLWYDGWWPFDAAGWQAQALLDQVRALKPWVLINPRSGLPGDFTTPEGHMGAPAPWRPWEACMSLNGSWGFHAGDDDWRTPRQVVDLLAAAAAGNGNLLLNLGPRGDGSLPEPAVEVLEAVGDWLRTHGEAVFGTEPFTMDLQRRGDHRGDWWPHGPVTVRGNRIYHWLRRWPGSDFSLAGLECAVSAARLLGGPEVGFSRRPDGTLDFRDFPDRPAGDLCPVLCLDCAASPSLYLCGGLRVPRVPHPHYDPCPSELVGTPGGH